MGFSSFATIVVGIRITLFDLINHWNDETKCDIYDMLVEGFFNSVEHNSSFNDIMSDIDFETMTNEQFIQHWKKETVKHHLNEIIIPITSLLGSDMYGDEGVTSNDILLSSAIKDIQSVQLDDGYQKFKQQFPRLKHTLVFVLKQELS